MDNTYFLLLIIIVLFVDHEDACQPCTYNHLQQQYCNNSIVLKAKILKVDLPKDRVDFYEESEYNFIMSVKTVFKGSDLIGRGKRRGKANIMCVAPLVKGDTMLIMGNIQSGGFVTLGVSLCAGVTRWSNLSKVQIKGLKSKYRKHCNMCKIPACFNEEYLYSLFEKCPHTDDPCFFSNTDSSCHFKHSYCVLKRGRCGWAKTKALKSCLSNN